MGSGNGGNSLWRRTPLNYATAVVAAAAAILLRKLLDPFVTGVQFITFFPAAMLVAYGCGARPALVTTVLCGLAGWYFFLQPVDSFVIATSAEIVSLLTFFLVSSVMSISIGGLADALNRERRHLDRQRLLTEEVNHRVKNNLSIVQSIAQQTLKPDACLPEVRAEFESRLLALAAAHDVLTRRSWGNARLADLLASLLRSVGVEDGRVNFKGPDVLVQPKAAVTLTLAIHELATNAIKYGALSVQTGRVNIDWDNEGERLQVRWQEQGGPPVRPPNKRGFGTRMVERALAREFGGSAKIDFRADGVVCLINAPLRDSEALELA
jgi:two-component sensor histidine kinase